MPSYVSPWAGLDVLGKNLFEVNPESAYTAWGQQWGFNPTQPGGQNRYRYGQAVYPFMQQDYYGKSAQNPGLQWTDYLDQLGGSGGGLGDMWSGLAPSQRGEQPGRFAPQVKWKM